MLKEIIPVIDMVKANRILKNKNESENIEIPENIEAIDIKNLEDDYKSTIEGKNRFEDKAKTIIAALTIAITLILNLSKITDTISEKFSHPAINILIFILAVISIIYMLMAGIVSIQVLIKENRIYALSAIDKVEVSKKEIYETIQYNINQNYIRNNMIFSAYRSIRNSVFCLVIVFVIAILPIQITNEDNDHHTMSNKYENVCFGKDAVNWMFENENKQLSIDKLIEQYNKGNTDNIVKNIYDKENKIVVTISLKDDVYVIENIIGNIEELK